MMEAIRSLFALVSLIIKSIHNAMKGVEIMSKEIELSARSLAYDQRLDREINAAKQKAKLDKTLKNLGLTREAIEASAKQRRESAESDDADNLA